MSTIAQPTVTETASAVALFVPLHWTVPIFAVFCILIGMVLGAWFVAHTVRQDRRDHRRALVLRYQAILDDARRRVDELDSGSDRWLEAVAQVVAWADAFELLRRPTEKM